MGRDFTINAIAFDLETGRLIDPYQGLSDLQQGRLRAVGSAAQRFEEDPLRLLRMLRFGPGENRSVDAQALEAAKNLAFRLEEISVERIAAEFSRILLSPYPQAALKMALELGLLPHFLPEIIPSAGFEQNEFHTQDVFDHSLAVVQATSADLILRLSALFHDIGKVYTLSIDNQGRRHFYGHEHVSVKVCTETLQRLRYSHEIISAVSTLIRLHMRPLTCGPAGIRRLMRDLGTHFERWIAFKIADVPAGMPIGELQKELASFQKVLEAERERQKGPAYGKLAINGHDLIGLGMKPGPQLGAVLKKIEELVIEDPELNQRETLLALAAKEFSTGP